MKKRIIVILIFTFLLLELDTVRAQDLPDFIVSDITWSPVNPAVGSSVTFTATIKNQGVGNAGTSYIYFYIDGLKVSESYVSTSASGAIVTKTFSWTVTSGTHSIKAVTDAQNSVTESDETNNEKTVSFIGTPSDLIISDITWSPINPAVGSSVTFSVSIKNQGGGGAVNSYVYYYIDGSKVSDSYVSSISASGIVTKTFYWTVTSGSHSIKAAADAQNSVAESDETNNEKTVSFSGTPSDLIISDITWSPVNPAVGSSVTFTASIKNQGAGDAVNSYVYFYIDGSKVSDSYVSSISAGGIVTKTFYWTVTSGSHSIKAAADAQNTVTESDETNNEKTVSFSGTPSDLIISDITWSPVNPAVGDYITYTTTIKNKGAGDAVNSYVYYYIDGSKVSDSYVSSISAGGIVTKTFYWTVTSGSHSIKAATDAQNTVTESDETNNEKTVSFIGTPSDLTISDISMNPMNPVVGDYVTFTATINNKGSGNSLSTNVYFYVDDSNPKSGWVASISAGGSSTASFWWKATEGDHSIKAFVDAKNSISESDETNNEKTIKFHISQIQEPTYASPTPTDKNTYPRPNDDNKKIDDTSPPSISINIEDIDLNKNHQLDEGEKIKITYGANDESGVRSIKLLFDGNIMSVQNRNGTFQITSDPLLIGDHTIILESLDTKGNNKSEEMKINVNRAGPSVFVSKLIYDVIEGDNFNVMISAINPIGNPKLDAQLVLKLPMNGVSVFESNCKGMAGICTSAYEIPPGDNVRSNSVIMRADRAGEYQIDAEVYYQYEDGTKSTPRYETINVVVKKSEQSNMNPEPIPGLQGIFGLFAFGLAFFYRWKREKSRDMILKEKF